MEIKKTSWQENFDETCQDILEDAFLLDALAMYITNDGYFMHSEKAACFPQLFCRLCGYLSQHTFDLCNLKRRLEPDP